MCAQADVIPRFDTFCGCGTTIDAAEKNGRQWIGIGITYLAIALIKNRLANTYGDNIHLKTVGEPVSRADAQQLAADDKYQFQADSWFDKSWKPVDFELVK